MKPASFRKRYGNVFDGGPDWKKVKVVKGQTYAWDHEIDLCEAPALFRRHARRSPRGVADIDGARILALFGDSITTDHISPAGSIKKDGPAGKYLIEHGIDYADFNSYGARRGNDEVMVRGTFANIRIRNEMMGGKEGGNTIYYSASTPSGEEMSIFDAAMRYQKDGVPTVVMSRDRPGADGHADAAQEGRGRQVRRVFRAGPQSRCRSPIARRSATCRPSMARRWDIFRSTIRRSLICG